VRTLFQAAMGWTDPGFAVKRLFSGWVSDDDIDAIVILYRNAATDESGRSGRPSTRTTCGATTRRPGSTPSSRARRYVGAR